MKPGSILIRILFLAIPCWAPGAGHACEGADLQETNQLYQHMVFVNQTCNEAGTVQDSMNCLQEEWGYTVQKLDKLPEPCREILKEFDPQAE